MTIMVTARQWSWQPCNQKARPWNKLLQIGAGAGAAVLDAQNSDGNAGGATKAPKMMPAFSDSLNGTNGNIGHEQRRR